MRQGLTTFICAIIALACDQNRATATTYNASTVTQLIADINDANANGHDDTIVLTTGTYTLTARDNGVNGLPAILSGHRLTILGNGSTIQRNAASTFRIFFLNSGSNLTLSGLTLSNGGATNFHGGAIYSDGTGPTATLTLINCVLSNNTADYGGAIWSDGSDGGAGGNGATLSVFNCTFANNFASQQGGAIFTESGSIVLNIVNSTFDTNSTNGSAGAVQFDASNGVATGSIVGCTFKNNSAGSGGHYGGAVNVDGFAGTASLTITNCTLSQNSAGFGGGIASDGSSGSATVVMNSCTFNANSAGTGGGIYLSTTTSGTTSLQLGNSILKSNGTAPNIITQGFTGGAPVFTSQGYNLSDDAAGGGAGSAPGGFLNHAGDIRNTDPLLDPAGLKDNGGPTQTIALQATSPALDKGKSNAGPGLPFSIDQRTEFRPFNDPNVADAAGGDGSDIGAYEATVRGVSEVRSGPGLTTLTYSFQTILGHTYEMQSNPTLAPGNWSTVNNSTPPPPIAGTGGIVSVTITNAIGPGTGFYRAHQLP